MRSILLAVACALCARSAFAQSAAPDLYTIDLVGTPELRRFSGTVELRPATSPFTAPVTVHGVHRFQPVITIDSLPDPRTLGDYTTYVAWAAPPALKPMQKLGVVGAGAPATLADIAFNRFTVFVSAERTASVSEPRGPFVLRGLSPSMRLGTPHVVQAAGGSADHAHAPAGWPMPLPHPRASTMYMPALAGLSPNATPFHAAAAATVTPSVKPRSLRRLANGDSLRLEAGVVKRVMRGREVFLYAFNGEQPGPLLDVQRGATVHVNFVNRTPLPTAVHWHGVRLDNRFDGVPHVTQDPVAAGDSFRYTVRFPDAGIYWYHPHHREDVQQDLGLYGNLLVRERERAAYARVHREEVVMLDDLLWGEDALMPHGRERATHALMGRFGNLLLINGEPVPAYRLRVQRGEVVRFFFTNVANTRTFNISFAGARMKLVGSDVGRLAREEWVESVVMAPAERYIVDVAFTAPGDAPLVNSVQAIDHTLGAFFPESDTLGVVNVASQAAQPDLKRTFDVLRRNDDVANEIARYARHFDRAPDAALTLTMKDNGLPFPLVQLLRLDTLYVHPVEWSGTMPMMDWLPTADQVTWTVRDQATGRENEDITWKFKLGEIVKLRLVNDRHTLHSMAHPIHIHGQRFLILSVNGQPMRNHGWKDTVLVPAGSVVDVLIEMSNPGMWMLHCHIAEHLEAGMKTVFAVTR